MKLTYKLANMLNDLLRNDHEVFVNGNEIEGIGIIDGMFDEARYFEIYDMNADHFQYDEGTEINVDIYKVTRERIHVEA